MAILAYVLIGTVVGYAATVHADFLIHRNIWHGRWKIVHHGPLRWLLYPHYVHHLRAHHSHANLHRGLLEEGTKVPSKSKARVESHYRELWNVSYGLRCTEHGITIHGIECLIHYWAVFFVTPQPYIAFLLWYALGPAAGIPASVMPVVAVYAQIQHRYYHMSSQARVAHVPPWLRRAVASNEFGRLASEHQAHHYDPRFRDDYYGVLPFGNRILRPLIGKN